MRFNRVPLKRLFNVVGGSTPASDNPAFWGGPVTWVTPVDLGENRYVSESSRTLSDAGYGACGAAKVPEGSLILSTRAPIGSLAIAAKELCTNQGCKALVPRAADSRYFYYQLSVRSAELNSMGRGSTFLELPASILEAVSLFAPSTASQTAIANFLDAKTAAIDALIAKKEALIKELEAYREAVIAEAVAPREGWRNLPAKRLFKRRREKNRPDAQLLTASINHGVVPKSSLSFKTNEPVHTDLALYQFVAAGDFVISLATFESGLEFSNCEGIISPAYTVVTPVEGLHPMFYRFYLKSAHFIAELFPYRKGIRQGQSISYDDFGSLTLPVPDMCEQIGIAERLETLTAKTRTLVEHTRTAIDQLRAYRASLISEAVTGKLAIEGACNG